MDLNDVSYIFHSKARAHTFFLSAHGTFSKTDHMVGHKTSLNKFKKIETICIMFSNSNRIKLAINDRVISEISPNIWK